MIGSDIIVPGGDAVPDSRAYAAIPEKPARGVVVIHEVYGPQPEIDRVAERFAARGYAAVAPALFEWVFSPRCLRNAMLTMQTGTGPFVDQLRHVRRWLCAETGLGETQVGLIGFCVGGGFALAAGRGWGAVSCNYGDVPPMDVLPGIGPVIGCYGGRDVLFRGRAELLKKRVETVGAEVEVHAFPTAGHAFLTDGHHPVGAALSWPLMHVRYDPAVAEEGWKAIMAFFDRHLGDRAA